MNSKTEWAEYHFESQSFDILPGVSEYHCSLHDIDLKEESPFFTEVGIANNIVHIHDVFVEENRFFKYRIIKPIGAQTTKKVIFLFHGFNEKDWDKYLPWANTLCVGTGCSVVLFPIAFHMQRAPKYWSNKREMFKLSKQRSERYPNIVASSLSNVAISMRLHSMPQRFILSGLQTYYDVIHLIEECQNGHHPLIEKDFEFDIFAYSIGGFLAQILKLTNHKGYFTNTKVGLFCSGATFNRLSPVSKFILDSEANVALYSFLVEHFTKILKQDEVLNHFINQDHPEGKIFHAMLEYQKMRTFREDLLKKYEDQIYAITLKKDDVIPSFEVMHTLKGAYRDINIAVDEFDFDRPYTHVNPFPADKSNAEQVAQDYNMVFKKFCDFYNG